jgi:hypothetical protein
VGVSSQAPFFTLSGCANKITPSKTLLQAETLTANCRRRHDRKT